MKERLLRMSGFVQMGVITALAQGAAASGVTPLVEPSAGFSFTGGAMLLIAWILIEVRLYRMQREERWPK